jgi:DNA-binding GntR family transcriptional regulator
MDNRKSPGRRKRLDSKGKLVISRLSLHEQVADQVRQLIVSGALPAGEKIPVSELAEQLGVSLTPLREALKVLAGEQLVELVTNRGARVAPLTVEDTRLLFEVIAGIESLAAELAAQRITPGELQEIEEKHAKMRQHHLAGELDPYFELNRDIHDLVVQAAKNPTLVQIRSQLAVRAERARYLSISSRHHRDESMEDHEGLMRALRARDPEAARKVWKLHLERSGDETCRVVQDWEDAGQKADTAAE